MYQFRDQKGPGGDGEITLSGKDRADAVRLLSLLVGSEDRRLDIDLVQLADAVLKDRRRRAELFNPSMFGEPAWELLLTLFVMDQHGPRLTIGRLAQLAETKMTTALRWLDYLDDQGFVRRDEHPGDARTSFVSLTDKARSTLRLYLSETIISKL